jgi:hypothetical protein
MPDYGHYAAMLRVHRLKGEVIGTPALNIDQFA